MATDQRSSANSMPDSREISKAKLNVIKGDVIILQVQIASKMFNKNGLESYAWIRHSVLTLLTYHADPLGERGVETLIK